MARIGKSLLTTVVLFFIQALFCMVNAQVLDTVFPSTEKSRYLYAHQLYELDSTTVQEDTVQHHAQRIHPAVQNEIAFLGCGYPGTPALPFRLTSGPVKGFDHGVHAMDVNFFGTDSIKLYRSPVPRTFLKYSQGTGELIYLVAEHSQNIFDRWNFGVNYRRIKAQNFYYDNIDGLTLARIPNNYNLSAYTRFFTQNRKYEAVATYTWNKATIAETGGIVSTEKFDTLDRRTKQYFNSVFLPGASNVFLERDISVTQFFRFGTSRMDIRENKDTVGVMDTLELFTPKGHFYHDVSYLQHKYNFTDEDPNMAYYPVRLISFMSNDSFVVKSLVNRFGLFLLPSEKAPRLDVSVSHEWITIDQSGYLTDNIHQLWLNGKVLQPILGQMIAFSGRYGVFGYNAGDIHLGGDLKLNSGSRDTSGITGTASAEYSRYKPSYLQNYFVSNHYLWYNDLDQMGYALLRVGARYKHHLHVQGAVERFEKPIVYASDGMPRQMNSVQIASAEVRNRVDLWRFHLSTVLLFKIVPDNSPIRYPLFSAKESFYYEGYFFKQNMKARIGVDLYYYSAFKANYYNPVTRQFQLQDEFELGNYPLFDVFFTGTIRTVDLFLVYRHASAGLFGNDYYASPRYPQIPSSFRLGLSWRLFN